MNANFRHGIKTNYDRRLKSSACGSLSNLMNVTSTESDWTKVNPKKYYKRFKEFSSDIFSSDLLSHAPTRRSVDSEFYRQSSDLAGNYKLPPNHEFYDVINTKFD